jgi:hypothetical protein
VTSSIRWHSGNVPPDTVKAPARRNAQIQGSSQNLTTPKHSLRQHKLHEKACTFDSTTDRRFHTRNYMSESTKKRNEGVPLLKEDETTNGKVSFSSTKSKYSLIVEFSFT